MKNTKPVEIIPTLKPEQINKVQKPSPLVFDFGADSLGKKTKSFMTLLVYAVIILGGLIFAWKFIASMLN